MFTLSLAVAALPRSPKPPKEAFGILAWRAAG
jgi:hypothetical protein